MIYDLVVMCASIYLAWTTSFLDCKRPRQFPSTHTHQKWYYHHDMV